MAAYGGGSGAYLIAYFFTGQMLFLMPNQQCQSTEGEEESNAIQ